MANPINPNGPPPKFPLSQVNPGPETKQEWSDFIRWLLLFWQQAQSSQQFTQVVGQQMPPIWPFPLLRPEGLPYTFEFDALTTALTTNPLRIQHRTTTTPYALDISAGGGPISGPALFDVQTSPDQVTWTSILPAPAQLAQNALHAPTIFTFRPGALLIPGQWIRGQVAAGSDLSATAVALQLAVM